MNEFSQAEILSDVSGTSFDCAPYIGHGMQWPHNDYSFSAAKLRQFELALSSRSSASEARDEFYSEEYNDLLAYMEQDLADDGNIGCEREQILNISELADEDLGNNGVVTPLVGIRRETPAGPGYWNGSTSSQSIDELALWEEMLDNKKYTDKSGLQTFKKKSLVKESLKSPHLQFMVHEHLQGFGEKRPEHWEPLQEDANRKRRLCRHFLKGHCKRGRACDFLHDPSIFCPDFQKVFLGGLPAHITDLTLQEKLTRQGYTVINKPKVLRGFTPQVCLGSVKEAQQLIKKGRIFIDGSQVDVRPYEAFAKDDLDKRLPDDTKRSVFIGGLSNGTTGQMIIYDLEKLDVKVVNHPLIKTGFTPKVTLGAVEQAQKLIKMKKVQINHSLVDIRPYVNFRDSPMQRKKRY